MEADAEAYKSKQIAGGHYFNVLNILWPPRFMPKAFAHPARAAVNLQPRRNFFHWIISDDEKNWVGWCFRQLYGAAVSPVYFC